MWTKRAIYGIRCITVLLLFYSVGYLVTLVISGEERNNRAFVSCVLGSILEPIEYF